MSPNLVVYHAILFNKRVAAYQFRNEYWYVIEWGKKAYLHYTEKVKANKKEFYWYLADSTLWPEWKCQTELLTVSSNQPDIVPQDIEDYLEAEFEKRLAENPGCDIYNH